MAGVLDSGLNSMLRCKVTAEREKIGGQINNIGGQFVKYSMIYNILGFLL